MASREDFLRALRDQQDALDRQAGAKQVRRVDNTT